MKKDNPFPAMFFFLACALASLGPSPLAAEESTAALVVAPPPVGYPVMVKHESTGHSGANLVYSSLDLSGTDMTFLGASGFGGWQYCPLDRVALNLSAGATVLAGSENGTLLLQIPGAGSLAFEAVKGSRFSLFAFGGAGVNAGLMRMTVTDTQPIPYTTTFVDDVTSLGTAMISGTVSGGLQANVYAGKFVFSPFGVYAFTRGRYNTKQTSTMSFEYPETSGATDPVSSAVLGFEILYTPRGIALSSQMRKSEDYTLVTAAFKWLPDLW